MPTEYNNTGNHYPNPEDEIVIDRICANCDEDYDANKSNAQDFQSFCCYDCELRYVGVEE